MDQARHVEPVVNQQLGLGAYQVAVGGAELRGELIAKRGIASGCIGCVAIQALFSGEQNPIGDDRLWPQHIGRARLCIEPLHRPKRAALRPDLPTLLLLRDPPKLNQEQVDVAIWQREALRQLFR